MWDSDRVTIAVDSVGLLRAQLYGADSTETARVLEVMVKDWARRGLIGPAGSGGCRE